MTTVQSLFTYYGHGAGTFLDLDQRGQILDVSDVSNLSLDHVLVAMWMSCHSSDYNGGWNFVSVSVAQGADCSLGWDDDVMSSCFPMYAGYFWADLCRLGRDVNTAADAAAWDTWIGLGNLLAQGVFTWRTEGNTDVVPARFGN